MGGKGTGRPPSGDAGDHTSLSASRLLWVYRHISSGSVLVTQVPDPTCPSESLGDNDLVNFKSGRSPARLTDRPRPTATPCALGRGQE